MQPVTRRHWRLRGEAPEMAAVSRLARELNLHPLAASLLARRGYAAAADARDFLTARLADLPDPFLLPDMEVAAQRLAKAIFLGEPISIHGDYDVDGISGTALLVEGLRGLGGAVDYYIPLRRRDGYGLCAENLQEAAARGTKVAVSVDCGVSAVEEAQLARSLGLDLIITDHHQPPEQLPEALAVIDPYLATNRFPYQTLAGVGVAFLLLVAVRKRLREEGFFAGRSEPDLRLALDLVALGTIADLVPLTGVNRTLTRLGLKVLTQGGRPGLKALCEVGGVREVTCSSVAFALAPRLNAAGRIENAALAVDLLLEPNYASARSVALRLDTLNRDRQVIEQQTFAEAVRLLETEGREVGAIVLAHGDWHSGVIGIVASRLVERYHRPTVLIALEGERGKGSARSIPGLHLYDALQRCQEHLLGFGGHAHAAGLSISSAAVEAFHDAFTHIAGETLTPDDLVPALGHDGEVLLEELSREAVMDLGQLAPFGSANPEPLFLLREVRVQQLCDCGEKHLRFTARQGGFSLPCIAFNFASRREEFLGREVDLLVVPQFNTWQGRTQLQLRVKDFQPSESL